MEAQTNRDQANNGWFDFYVKELASSPKTGFKKADDYYLCPCCHFPTLTERGKFDICFLCNWEDDGQDDHNADLILGGPNQSYSLSEARRNFRQYFTSYRPSDTYHFERTTVKKSDAGKTISLIVLKKQIMERYIAAIKMDDANKRKQIFSDIKKKAKRM